MKSKSLLTLPFIIIPFLTSCNNLSRTFAVLELEEPNSEISPLMEEYDAALDTFYAGKAFYNCTPKTINDICKIYKYQVDCATYLEYNNSIYQIGGFYGGDGVTQLAYYKTSSKHLLFFLYSCGSGIHAYCVGAFDFNESKVKNINCALGEKTTDCDAAFGGNDPGFGLDMSVDIYKTTYTWKNRPFTFDYKLDSQKLETSIEKKLLD